MPRVSVIVPALNEERHIEACVRSILEQEVEGGLEVVVADGRSTDATAERARAAGARVVDNPRRVIPAALNAARAAATGEFVVRFDAHSEMPPGYVEACLRALAEEEGAANVGGWCDARGVGPWGKALGAALGSRFGVGNARLWRRPRPGAPREDVDSVPFGCFRREELDAIGGWRDELLTNEDFELNHRLRTRGRRVVFDPAIWSVYRPRESLAEIARQYWRYGRWKSVVLRQAPESLRPRQLAPLALLGVVAVAATPTRVAWPARAALGAYALTLGGVAARSGAGWRTAAVIATMHGTWAAGVVTGFAARAAGR